MKTSDLDRIIASRPVDRLAARVTAQGETWQPDIRPDEDRWSDTPPPMFPPPINPGQKFRKGERFGRLVVVGYAGRSKGYKGSRYVCRCDCGKYGVRVAHKLRRANGPGLMCDHCRYLEDIKAGRTPFVHRDRSDAELRREALEAARGKPVSVFAEAVLRAGGNR